MYYKLKMLESDLKLEKFKQGLIDSIRFIKIKGGLNGHEGQHSMEHNKKNRDIKTQYRLFTESGYDQQSTCNVSIVKQRNSFPFPNSKFRKNPMIGQIFNKPNPSHSRPKRTKKQKLFQIIRRIQNCKSIDRISNPQRFGRTDNTNKCFYDVFKREREQGPLLKIRGSLNINKKIIGRRLEDMPTKTLYPSFLRVSNQKQNLRKQKKKQKTVPLKQKVTLNEAEQLCRWKSEDENTQTNF